MGLCVCICVCVCVCVCVFVCVYVCVYLCVYVCVCVYVWTMQTFGCKVADGFENQRNISCYSPSDSIMASAWDELVRSHLCAKRCFIFGHLG